MSESPPLPYPEPGIYWVKRASGGTILCGGIFPEGALPIGKVPAPWELMEFYGVDSFSSWRNKWGRIGWDTPLEHSEIHEIGPRVLPPEE